MVQMIARSPESLGLLQQGAIALAEVESNGICIDTDYIERTVRRCRRRVKRLTRQLDKTDVMKAWRRRFKSKTNTQSNVQLAEVLYDVMGFKPPEQETKGGQRPTNEKSLGMINDPFVQKYLEIKKLRKAINTNLLGLLREVVDGKLHCFFNLHTVQTYRSSSDAINFQNQPVRDEMIMNLVRTAFVPRKGRRLCEVDYSGIEVRIAACYHKDPRMIDYICDPSKDMHRDMAMECYKLPLAEVTKNIRYCGKNMFVFPQFYGDWYIDCARSLWDAMGKLHLTTTSGTPLRQHLMDMGIRRLGDLDPREKPQPGTFEAHIQQVERRFWKKRFPVYDKWKTKWFEQYKKRGYFETLTGFVCQGHMKRNEVINYPVQGSAFHCLLWSLIRIVRRELKRRKMKTLIVGQIHDSIVADVPDEEMDEYLALCQRVMVDELRKHWPWIIVPLEIEAEATAIDEPWSKKVKVTIAA